MCQSTQSPWVIVSALLPLLMAGCNHSGSFELREHPDADKSRVAVNSGKGFLQLDATIIAPHEGDIITTDVYDDMQFLVESIPNGVELWVFIRDRYNFFVQYLPPALNARRLTITQRNIRLVSDGAWEIHVCAATPTAGRLLENAVQRGEYAFARLPEGVHSVDFVVVERK